MSSTASGVTVISAQDANNASPVNLSSAIVDLNHVLRRRSIENVRSADAVMQHRNLDICRFWGVIVLSTT